MVGVIIGGHGHRRASAQLTVFCTIAICHETSDTDNTTKLLKKLLGLLLAIIAPLAVSAQNNLFPSTTSNNTFTGTNAFVGVADINLHSYIVATLPTPASTTIGFIVTVTDAATPGSCTLGGGSGYALCRNNGTTWSSLGGNGSTGTITSVATASPITGGPVTSGAVTIACALCALTSNPLSQFAATTSSQLAGVISDETGSGFLVFATSPSLTTPNLGTPTTLVLTNAVSLPFTSLVSGTNTAAAMVCGTGCSINYSGSGTINASSVNGIVPTILGSIGTNQIAVGTSSNTIGGSSTLTYNSGTHTLSYNDSNSGAQFIFSPNNVATIQGSYNSTTGGGQLVIAQNTTFQNQAAANLPMLNLAASPYSGGTSTTNVGQVLIGNGTAATTLSTGGTGIEFNPLIGFVGNFWDAHVNGGSSVAKLDYQGNEFLGTDNSSAGTLTLSNGSANAHTIWSSAATTSNTIAGFTAVPTNGHIVTCTVSGSTCTLTDGGAPSGSGTVTSVVIAGTTNQINVGGTCTITTSGTCTLTLPAAVILGTDNSTAGTLQLANGSASAHTIWSSGATTTNTVAGPATVPTSTHLLACTTASTTCTLTDSGIVDTAAGLLAACTGCAPLASPSFTGTPALNTATGTSLLLTGIMDGTVPVGVSTGTSCTLGTTSGCTTVAYNHAYQFNQEATAGTGVTYTLPATAVGKQYCAANSGTTGVINTGILTVYPPSSSYVILNGVVNTVGGGGTHGVASGGAAGDAACFVAMDATHWQVFVTSGTWSEN